MKAQEKCQRKGIIIIRKTDANPRKRSNLIMEKILYTAGEIAKIAGVSLRTIRFYDAKGLQKPVS